jgi:signal transduction histidine kinase
MLPKFKLEFLWDEEKSRKFLRNFSLVVVFGALIGIVHALLLPNTTPLYHRVVLIINDLIVGTFCLLNVILLRKPNPALRLLITFIILQFSAVITMNFTGGFRSPIQFGPYGLMIMAAFQLGHQSVLILSTFAIFTFVAMFLWQILVFQQPNVFLDAFFYGGIYIILMFLFKNLGKDLLLQIEARKKLEQVDDLKNQFIALSSHYLRTPLTVIKGFTGRLKNTELTQEQQGYLERINISTIVLDGLVEKFLLISSIQRGQAKLDLQESDLTQFLIGLIYDFSELAEKAEVNLSFHKLMQNDTVLYLFDRVKLRQAIYYLIDNAIKFNHPQGKVDVYLNRGSDYEIKITDTGKGIKKEQLDSFFTTFNKGGMKDALTLDNTGPGLSIYLAKLIIEAHGGRIYVSSREGNGTTFTINLPTNVQN